MCHSCVPKKMRWFLKLQFDKKKKIINQMTILKVTSFLEGHKSDTRKTSSITWLRVRNLALARVRYKNENNE